jgi:histone-arginine methyltransferase CARM1
MMNNNEVDKNDSDMSHKGWGIVHGGYYAQLPNQQNMLEDAERTGAYHQSIALNMQDFIGKVVLDVGAGSGILSFFAAQAGAKKVYAVEATEMANYARKLVEANGLSDRIEVIQEKLEDLVLPEKVDIIISEPMGLLLVHERMMEIYAIARKRWLKTDGKLFPNKGTIFLAPFSDQYLHSSHIEKARFWESKSFYGIDMTCLADTALNHYFARPIVGPVDLNILMANPSKHEIDFLTVDPEDYGQIEFEVNYEATATGLVHGLAGWFDVLFEGSVYQGHLTTAPSAAATHWHQIRFLFQHPIAMNRGQQFRGVVKLIANSERSYDMLIEGELVGTGVRTQQNFYIQNHLHWWHSSSKPENAPPHPENYGLSTVPILNTK